MIPPPIVLADLINVWYLGKKPTINYLKNDSLRNQNSIRSKENLFSLLNKNKPKPSQKSYSERTKKIFSEDDVLPSLGKHRVSAQNTSQMNQLAKESNNLRGSKEKLKNLLDDVSEKPKPIKNPPQDHIQPENERTEFTKFPPIPLRFSKEKFEELRKSISNNALFFLPSPINSNLKTPNQRIILSKILPNKNADQIHKKFLKENIDKNRLKTITSQTLSDSSQSSISKGAKSISDNQDKSEPAQPPIQQNPIPEIKKLSKWRKLINMMRFLMYLSRIYKTALQRRKLACKEFYEENFEDMKTALIKKLKKPIWSVIENLFTVKKDLDVFLQTNNREMTNAILTITVVLKGPHQVDHRNCL